MSSIRTTSRLSQYKLEPELRADKCCRKSLLPHQFEKKKFRDDVKPPPNAFDQPNIRNNYKNDEHNQFKEYLSNLKYCSRVADFLSYFGIPDVRIRRAYSAPIISDLHEYPEYEEEKIAHSYPLFSDEDSQIRSTEYPENWNFEHYFKFEKFMWKNNKVHEELLKIMHIGYVHGTLGEIYGPSQFFLIWNADIATTFNCQFREWFERNGGSSALVDISVGPVVMWCQRSKMFKRAIVVPVDQQTVQKDSLLCYEIDYAKFESVPRVHVKMMPPEFSGRNMAPPACIRAHFDKEILEGEWKQFLARVEKRKKVYVKSLEQYSLVVSLVREIERGTLDRLYCSSEWCTGGCALPSRKKDKDSKRKK